MSFSLLAAISSRLDIKETADSTTSPGSSGGGSSRTFDGYSLDVNLNSLATSYPQLGGQVVDLSCTIEAAGTKDFDLTAAPWAGDITKTVNLTGKKLVAILLRANKGNNANGVTFGPQGGNGYALFGASKTKILWPGLQQLDVIADPDQDATFTVQTPPVAAGAKDLRFTGTSGDVIKCLAVFSA